MEYQSAFNVHLTNLSKEINAQIVIFHVKPAAVNKLVKPVQQTQTFIIINAFLADLINTSNKVQVLVNLVDLDVQIAKKIKDAHLAYRIHHSITAIFVFAIKDTMQIFSLAFA